MLKSGASCIKTINMLGKKSANIFHSFKTT